MSTYAYVTLAGSAGKTTSAVTTAVDLALSGRRVRFIDLDSQSTASKWLGYHAGAPDFKEVTRANIGHVLREDATIAEVERPARRIKRYVPLTDENGEPELDESGEPVYGPEWENIPNLTVLPAIRTVLDRVMIELPAATGGVQRLRDALEAARAYDAEHGDPVDVTIIDCGGSLTPLVIAGIVATAADKHDKRPGAWGIITCTKSSGKENDGIGELLDELPKIKKGHGVLAPLLSIMPCAVPTTGSVYEEQGGYLRDAFGDVVAPNVRRATIADEALTNKVPFAFYGYKTKQLLEDYRAAIKHQREENGLFPLPLT